MFSWMTNWWKKNHDSVERIAAAELVEAAMIPLSADEQIAVLEAALLTAYDNKKKEGQPK